jgi:hypothetical protein
MSDFSMKEIVLKLLGILLSAVLVSFVNPGFQLNAQTSTPVGITVGQPPYGFNVIPSSTRRLFATVTNGVTNQVTWTIKAGSAKLSSSSGPWVDVVAPTTGSSCAYSGTSANYTVTSGTTFTIEATAVDDVTKKADVVFNVCNPGVQVAVIPFYRTLYADQAADIQSMILGSVDQNVHWTISSQPLGGDGKLGDTTSRDTVFSATVAGRYTLTATSEADPHQTASAIMFVTGNKMPYQVTKNLTEPVDCTVDPAMVGHVYEVGPSQTYKTLASVPFPTIAPGSTVRLHNEDTTGANPTQYHEYVQLSQAATATQPFRMCGVPDAAGNEPIIDGANATGRSDTSIYAAGYGLVTLHNPNSWAYWPTYNSAAYITVEGIHFRNAKPGFNYTAPNGTASQWGSFAACLRINQGRHTVFVGNDIENCGNGQFEAWNGNGGWGASDLYVLTEGNHFHMNGAIGSYLSHQLYLQSWGEVVQFNRIDNYQPGAYGSNLKTRGIQTVIRYNYLGDGAARELDLVDVQDAPMFMSYDGYLTGGSSSYHALYPQDNYPADLIAAEQEAWNSHFVYGNIYQNSTAAVPIHFSYDHDGGELGRKGNLYWYNNTFYETLCANCSGQQWSLFDTTAGGGSYLPQTEFQTVQMYNNIVWMDDPTRPVFDWNNYTTFIGIAGKNLVPTNWGSNNQAGGSGTGWVTTPNSYAYQNATNLASHVTGFNSTNLMTTSTIPFNATTWALNNDIPGDTVVPSAVCEMPTRFAYVPSLSYAVSRLKSPNIGATDTSQEMAAAMTTIVGPSRYNTRYSNCQ